jgi:hypothetical protein
VNYRSGGIGIVGVIVIVVVILFLVGVIKWLDRRNPTTFRDRCSERGPDPFCAVC